MEGLYLGLDLSDEGCTAALMDPQTEKVQALSDDIPGILFPGLLCYDLESDEWIAGKAAENYQNKDNCIILYKLVSLLKSGQTLSLNEITYSAEELLLFYVNAVISSIKAHLEDSYIMELGLCMENLSILETERLMPLITKVLGFSSDHIHILNRQECFVHYLMSLNKEFWTNSAYLLDYNVDGLDLYRLVMKKNGSKTMAIAETEHMTDVPDVREICNNQEYGQKADRYFADLIEKLVNGQIVNSFLLSGEGFADIEWADQMVHTAVARKSRKVYKSPDIFCMGAACAAYHKYDLDVRFPYMVICDDHVGADVILNLDGKDGKQQLILVSCGTGFQEARGSLDLLLEDADELELDVHSAGASDSYKLHLSLDSFMRKDQDRVRITLNLAFINAHDMLVKIIDRGFGEFYPSTGKTIIQKFSL